MMHELLVLGLGGRVVARLGGVLETAEISLDRGRVAAVLRLLALGPQNPLLL